MTSSHRPTWAPIKGTDHSSSSYYVPSLSFSARDQPSQLALKRRHDQAPPQQLLREQLLKRQRAQLQTVQAKDLAFSEIQPGLRKLIARPQEQWFVAEQDPDDEQFCKEVEAQEQDQEEQLMREFERVRKQKEEQQRRRAMEQERLRCAEQGEWVSRKWYEETVFQGQGRQRAEQRGFLNDNVRSQFNRKFIHRFIMR